MDADARFVGLEVRTGEEAHVVGRDDRAVEPCGERQRRFDEMRLVGVTRARQLEVPAILEVIEPFARTRFRRFGLVREQQLADVALPAGKSNEARARPGEPLRLRDRVITMAPFEIGA